MTGPGEADRRRRRSAARLAAVQALYEIEFSGHSSGHAIEAFAARGRGAELDGDSAPADSALFAEIVRGVTGRTADLDRMIDACLSEGRAVARMEALLRHILRAGAYELVGRGNVDARVAISEYVAVSEAFFSGGETAVVNAVLDRLAHTLRPEEFEAADGG